MIRNPVSFSLYTVILGIALTGNTLLITAILKFKHLRTPSNLLVLNLSICDLLLVLALPFAIVESELQRFIFGSFGCKLLNPLSTMATNSAVFTLLFIAMERFYAINYPHRFYFNKQRAVVSIVIVHILGLATVIPYGYHLKISNSQCIETWTLSARRLYTVFLFILQYGIPLPVMTTLYFFSWRKVRKQNDKIIKIAESHRRRSFVSDKRDSINYRSTRESLSITNDYSPSKSNTDSIGNITISRRRSRRLTSFGSSFRGELLCESSIKRYKQTMRTLKMFICVVVVFAICMCPNQVTWLWTDFGNGEGPNAVLKSVFYFIMFCSSCCNPWIYGGYNKLFREAYQRILCFACPLGQKSRFSLLSSNSFRNSTPPADKKLRRIPSFKKKDRNSRAPNAIWARSSNVNCDKIDEEVKMEDFQDSPQAMKPKTNVSSRSRFGLLREGSETYTKSSSFTICEKPLLSDSLKSDVGVFCQETKAKYNDTESLSCYGRLDALATQKSANSAYSCATGQSNTSTSNSTTFSVASKASEASCTDTHSISCYRKSDILATQKSSNSTYSPAMNQINTSTPKATAFSVASKKTEVICTDTHSFSCHEKPVVLMTQTLTNRTYPSAKCQSNTSTSNATASSVVAKPSETILTNSRFTPGKKVSRVGTVGFREAACLNAPPQLTFSEDDRLYSRPFSDSLEPRTYPDHGSKGIAEHTSTNTFQLCSCDNVLASHTLNDKGIRIFQPQTSVSQYPLNNFKDRLLNGSDKRMAPGPLQRYDMIKFQWRRSLLEKLASLPESNC